MFVCNQKPHPSLRKKDKTAFHSDILFVLYTQKLPETKPIFSQIYDWMYGMTVRAKRQFNIIIDIIQAIIKR